MPDVEESVPPPPPSTVESSPTGSIARDIESVGSHREGESCDSVAPESHAEILDRNDGRNTVMAVATRASASYGRQDWPDSWESDEDEEEETDSSSHVPFPSKPYSHSFLDVSDADSQNRDFFHLSSF